ncbi:MAG TPA: Zn-dependent hydrolase, partial [Bacteroidales bacterium]|nr:Zn-dependent hydrolase [Bacteroidales bacterium]
MEMKESNIDFVVGPIENYEDGLFGYKAAHESFVLVKDPDWSAKLAKFNAMLTDLQAGLPVTGEYKSEKPGTDADMNVYYALYYAGDCNAGSKTIAINLPNDPEIHLAVGSRKLQLRNAMEAKFNKILLPIASMLIDESQREHITFNAFFENTTFHEVSHGMGIKNTINGKGTVREALKEQYSALEEAKADIMGLYLVTRLYE